MAESGKLTIAKSSETSSESKCPECGGRGFIPYIDENGYEIYRECRCHKAERLQNNRKFANIPKAYKDIRLNDIGTDLYDREDSKKTIELVKKLLQKYVENFDKSDGHGFYLYSDTKGSGKTNIAIATLNEVAKANESRTNFITYRFATIGQILDTIKNSFDKNNDSSEKFIDDLVTTDLLVIDDFGMEKVTEWSNEKVYDIINSRYIEKKATILTSNYSIDKCKYDERISNRLREMCFELHFPEESLRRKVGIERAKKFKEEIS